MGKEQAVTDPHGVPTGSVPRKAYVAEALSPSFWGPLMHEEPTHPLDKCIGQVKEQMESIRMVNYGIPGIDYRSGRDAHPANTKQIAGDHYKGKGIQPWDYVASNNLGYFEETAIKYLTRWKDKGGVDDLKKAVHFIEKLIELQS